MTRPDGKPSKQEVKKKILEVFSEHKSTNNEKHIALLYKFEKENCYCIEGVFCEAGKRLGFEGSFKPDCDHKFGYAMVEQGKEVLWGTAPPSLFDFLGLPFRLTKDLIKKHDPTLGEVTLSVLIWNNIHDSTDISLKRLVDLAVSLLKEDENVS